MDRMERDVMHLSANQEDIQRTINDIAGMVRDQNTERRLLSKLAHVLGWIISGAIAWFAHGQFSGR